MFVKTIHGLHGPDGITPPGHIKEIADETARTLITLGYVEAAEAPEVPEVPEPEKSPEKPAGKSKGK